MIFQTSDPLLAQQAISRLNFLIEKGAKVELKEKRGKRTLSQNNYIHLILTSWGIESGLDLEEMKQMIKTHLLPSMFKYEKKGVTLYRSTAALDTKEMTVLIDKIRSTAYESTGFYIPAPDEAGLLESMQNQVDRYKE